MTRQSVLAGCPPPHGPAVIHTRDARIRKDVGLLSVIILFFCHDDSPNRDHGTVGPVRMDNVMVRARTVQLQRTPQRCLRVPQHGAGASTGCAFGALRDPGEVSHCAQL